MNIKKFLKKTALILTILAGALAIQSGAFARNVAQTVEISADVVKAEPGSEASVAIKLSKVPVTGIRGAQLDIFYDKKNLEITKVAPGEIVKNPLYDISNNSKNDFGTSIMYSDYDLGEKTSIDSDGTLCTLKFKIKSDCPSNDYLIKVKLHQTKNGYTSQVEEVKLMGKATSEGTVRYESNFTDGLISVGGKNTRINLQIDDSNMYVNGEKKEVDPGKGTKPAVINGRTMLPIRSVVEAMGGNIDYDADSKKITIKIGDSGIELWIDKTGAKVNGSDKTLDVAPQIINGRTFVPLRFIGDNTGCGVLWEPNTKTVMISK